MNYSSVNVSINIGTAVDYFVQQSVYMNTNSRSICTYTFAYIRAFRSHIRANGNVLYVYILVYSVDLVHRVLTLDHVPGSAFLHY